jgi:Arabinose-binding domain of AraC transcription regulator, N-term
VTSDRARPAGPRTSDRAPQLGVSRDTLLREAKIDERQLRDPAGRVPLAAIARLWRAVASSVSDPALGLRVGADVHVREFGVVGYALAFSSTVGSALRRLSRHSRILSDAHALTLEAEGEATWLRLDIQPELRAFRPAVDYRLAAILSMCREIAAAPQPDFLPRLRHVHVSRGRRVPAIALVPDREEFRAAVRELVQRERQSAMRPRRTPVVTASVRLPAASFARIEAT